MPRCLLLLAGLAAAACGATHAAGDGLQLPSDSGIQPGDSGLEAEVAAPCTAPPETRPDGGTCVLEATGTVQDLSGARLPDLVVTMCSPTICFGSRADDAGAYAIPVGDFVVTQNYAVHADGRPDHAVDYFRLAAGEPSVIRVDMHLPPLPPSTVLLPPDGTPATNVTVGDLTLQVAAGTKFDLDVEDFGTTAGRTLRVAPVPLASAPPYAAANRVAGIYALAPSGAKPSQKMGVLLRNAAGLPHPPPWISSC